MGLGIYPVFEPKLNGTKFDSTGEALAYEMEELEEIAKAAKLTPLTTFVDNRPIPDDFSGDPDELIKLMGESTEWFDPNTGKAAMQALAKHIRSKPDAVKGLEWKGEVLVELEALARILTVAANQRARFRLELG
ncbi:hypothetical protein [Singulisphaera sp. PoT]|uniref:hypothetical protein n=1 Tax=Singulisphaera sp. PoT TaxID=3411797 RepID=UPI003BF479DC